MLNLERDTLIELIDKGIRKCYISGDEQLRNLIIKEIDFHLAFQDENEQIMNYLSGGSDA